MDFLKRLLGAGWRRGAADSSAPITPYASARNLTLLLRDIQDKSSPRKSSAIMSISLMDQSAAELILRKVDEAELGPAKAAAIEALGFLGNPISVEPLCALLKNANHPRLIEAVAHALARLADQRCVETILTVASELQGFAPSDLASSFLFAYSVRKKLSETLGVLGDERAVPVLRRALGDAESFVVDASAKALADLGPAGVDALIAELKGPARSKYFHSSVARALEESALLGERQISSLIEIIENGSLSDEIRWQACDVLGAVSDRRTVGPLITALKEHSWRLRVSAVNALGRSGDPRAFAPLTGALRDPEIREHGAKALGRLSDQRAVKALKPLLSEGDESLRLTVSIALARLNDAEAREHLIGFTRDSKSKSQCLKAAEALAELGDRRAVSSLMNLLSEKEESLRRDAVTALGKFAGAPVTEVIAKRLKDSELGVRLAAAEALAGCGDQRGFDLMIMTLLTDSLEHHLLPSIRGLGSLRDPRAVAPLVLCLRGSRGAVRRAIISALRMLGAPAREALRPLLADPRPLVRNDAQSLCDAITKDLVIGP